MRLVFTDVADGNVVAGVSCAWMGLDKSGAIPNAAVDAKNSRLSSRSQLPLAILSDDESSRFRSLLDSLCMTHLLNVDVRLTFEPLAGMSDIAFSYWNVPKRVANVDFWRLVIYDAG